jgi:DNA-binding NarL/FixJ family response regulator
MAASPFRILIADDHEVLCEGLRSLLEADAAWQVVGVAHDGREALRLAIETKPDIAILDYSLPQMNGLELTRAIKAQLPSTEILIFTMHDRESVVLDVFRAGARGFVLKSDDTRHLLAALESLSRREPYFSGPTGQTILEFFLESKHDTGRNHVLTAREREVLQLIAEGQSNKKAAYTLGLSVKTIETHRSVVMHKLKLRTTAELVRYAIREDIIVP